MTTGLQIFIYVTILVGLLVMIFGMLYKHRRKKRSRTKETDEVLMSTNQIAIIAMLTITVIVIILVGLSKLGLF